MAGWAAPEKKEDVKPVILGPTENITYRLVGLALDILFFVLFILINLVCTIIFLVPLSTNGS